MTPEAMEAAGADSDGPEREVRMSRNPAEGPDDWRRR